MIRLFDFIISFFGLIFLSPILILLWIIVRFDCRHPLYSQVRVGRYQRTFIIVKFRTMKLNTPSTATHLVKDSFITKFGHFLRRTNMDEIPQLWNVLIGNMSLVGPRPCLLNQKKLINERKKRGVFKVKPGITGLAQISDINMKKPTLLAKTDLKMIQQMNLFKYFYYILKTLIFILNK